MMDSKKIKRRFLHSLKRGTGEVYLIAKKYPEIDFSKEIIKGALNIYAYDGQCEMDRADYIYGLISGSKKKGNIRLAVLKGLSDERSTTWNLTHLFAIAYLYALQNDEEAKKAIYDRFLNFPIDGSDWVGCYEILNLDGFKGLLYIAEKYGNYLQENPDLWIDFSVVRQFQDKNKEIKVLEELENNAKLNRFIGIYLDRIKQTELNVKNKTKDTINYLDIVDEVLNSKPYFPFSKIRKLLPSEVLKIAERLRRETDTQKIEKLMDVFSYHKYPFDSDLILKLAKLKRSGKNKLVENSIVALKHLKSKEIRKFAIKKIKKSKYYMDYLPILIANYRTGDCAMLAEIAAKARDVHKIEQLAIIYTDIYQVNKTIECKEPLEIVYNKMNCAIHRYDVVKILMENKVLTKKIAKETKFDCASDTRCL